MHAKYYELEIAFNSVNVDEIYNELYLYDITSIIEENGILKVSLPEHQLEILESIQKTLINNNIVNNHSIFISLFENKDWNKEWEKTIEPVYIKDKLIIYPSWKKNNLDNADGKILIEIDPKMSFGTGHNETTQLILEMMIEQLDLNDKYVLDYGCGTAILAIAAVKLGVEHVIAIDIDEVSIENANDYININDAEKNITLYKSDIIDINEKDFDVICANITSSVIISNLKNIYNKLKRGGKLFITGILIEEKSHRVCELETTGFRVSDIRDKAEWTGIIAYSNKI